MSDDAYPEGEKQRLLYILDIDQRLSPPRLAVSCFSARMLKEGGYGKGVRYDTKRPPHPLKARFVLPLDHDIISDMRRLPRPASARPCEFLHGEEGAELLQRIVATGRAHWLDKDNPALALGDPRPARLGWQVDAQGRQRLGFDCSPAVHQLLPVAAPWYLDGNLCGPTLPDRHPAHAEAVLAAPAITVEALARFDDWLSRHLPAGIEVPPPQKVAIRDIRHIPPTARLQLYTLQPPPGRRGVASLPLEAARLSFLYEGVEIAATSNEMSVRRQIGNELVRIERDRAGERRLLATMRDLGFAALSTIDPNQVSSRDTDLFGFFDDEAWVEFMLRELPALRDDDWQIGIEPTFRFNLVRQEQWFAELKKPGGKGGEERFSLNLGVAIDGEKINLLPALSALLRDLPKGAPLESLCEENAPGTINVPLGDGRLLPIALDKVRSILDVLVELGDESPLEKDGQLVMNALQAVALAELDAAIGAGELSWHGDLSVREAGERLRNFTALAEATIPEGFHATLRTYQQEGLNWLQFLRGNSFGGILADDMGLGKTVQTLAHLWIEKAGGRMDRPSLVVAPTSLMTNWSREAAKFAPGLKVLTLHGPNRHDHFAGIDGADLVLTTYPLLVRDIDLLCNQPFHYLILDEAQIIKNPKSKANRAVRELQSRHRLALTGTPMENHLGELWAIFHFLMPGLLGSEPAFRRRFRIPIERDRDRKRQESLGKRVAPFLLRRTKRAVASDLPPKSEMVRSVILEGEQRRLYESIRAAMRERVRNEMKAKGVAGSQMVILDALMKLRQVCCDPRLLPDDGRPRIEESAKFEMLMEMVPEMIAEGSRILLFSQFTSMLALIEAELKRRRIRHVKLTGQTRDRAEVIEQFQNGDVPVFLISLKAGGVGLNLTAADTVIHYDPWWNPAAEDQATDRAYRIGQEKPVFVYRLLTEGTVEQRIHAMQQRKRELAENLYGQAEGMAAIWSPEEIEQLFAPLDEE